MGTGARLSYRKSVLASLTGGDGEVPVGAVVVEGETGCLLREPSIGWIARIPDSAPFGLNRLGLSRLCFTRDPRAASPLICRPVSCSER